MRQCSVDRCSQKFLAVGFCNKHYHRWKKYGDPHFTKMFYRNDEARLLSKVSVNSKTGCWEYLGRINDEGYGTAYIRKNNVDLRTTAHAVFYEVFVGERTPGMHIDHLCKVRHCVNPKHLEMITLAENNRRSDCPSGKNFRKTHCKRGHEFSTENTYIYKKSGFRACKMCWKER